MGLETRQQKKEQPFTPNEKRALSIRAERIDPKHLTGGKPPPVEAVHKRAERHPTHEARFYELTIPACCREAGRRNPCLLPAGRQAQSAIRNQLNHGNPTGDEQRLASIAEDLLSVVENPQSLPAAARQAGAIPACLRQVGRRNPQSGGEA